MIILQEKIPIWIGAIIDESTQEKAFAMLPVEDILNEHVDLSLFGSGLGTIHFVPVMLKNGSRIHEEHMSYSYAKRRLIIQTHLDYSTVESTPVVDFPSLIAQTFSPFIDQYQKHRVKDFDIAGFKKRVGEVFQHKGWLSKADLS